jgi:hypothetical protein
MTAKILLNFGPRPLQAQICPLQAQVVTGLGLRLA